MGHPLARKKVEIIKKLTPAPVIPIEVASQKRGADNKVQQELPLFYNKPIFKAKKHDPL